MSGIATRGEQIAQAIVSKVLDTDVIQFDTDTRQAAPDFSIKAADGHIESLEVTIVCDTQRQEFEAHLSKDHHVWEAQQTWHFSLPDDYANERYRELKKDIQPLVGILENHDLPSPADLQDSHLTDHPELRTRLIDHTLRLHRVGIEKPGIHVGPPSMESFLNSEPRIASVIHGFLARPHVIDHVLKLKRAKEFNRRHLFLVINFDQLPISYFTDDFTPPQDVTLPNDLDTLWCWSPFWHRVLQIQDGSSSWHKFQEEPMPPAEGFPHR